MLSLICLGSRDHFGTVLDALPRAQIDSIPLGEVSPEELQQQGEEFQAYIEMLDAVVVEAIVKQLLQSDERQKPTAEELERRLTALESGHTPRAGALAAAAIEANEVEVSDPSQWLLSLSTQLDHVCPRWLVGE